MTEFSQAYHLRSSDQNDGIDLLERTANPGWVLAPRDGWVSFVLDGDEVEQLLAIDDLAAAASTELLHTVVNGDMGWAIVAYLDGEELWSLRFDTDSGETVADGEIDPGVASCVGEAGFDECLEVLRIPREHAHLLDAHSIMEAGDGGGYGAIRIT